MKLPDPIQELCDMWYYLGNKYYEIGLTYISEDDQRTLTECTEAVGKYLDTFTFRGSL